MLSLPLLKKNMLSIWKPFVILFSVIVMYIAVIIYMFDPKLADMLTQYQAAMPQVMSAMGMGGMAATLLAFMQNYLYGFILLVFPMILSIIVVNKLVVSYGMDGSFACLLATPNSRTRIIVTQLASLLFTVFLLVVLTTVTELICAHLMFPGEMELKTLLQLNGALLLLQTAIAGIIFAAACLFQESKYFYTIGVGIPVLCFVFQMLGNMDEKLEVFNYLSIFTLFPDEEIVMEKSGICPSLLALLAISVVLYVGGILYFRQKDLNL